MSTTTVITNLTAAAGGAAAASRAGAGASATAVTYSTADEGVSLRERLIQLVYLFILGLAFFTLWEMAETRSLESRTIQYLPAADLPQLRADVCNSDSP